MLFYILGLGPSIASALVLFYCACSVGRLFSSSLKAWLSSDPVVLIVTKNKQTVPLIFSFSKTLPWLIHFPMMKEPCIWEISVQTFIVLLGLLLKLGHILKQTT